MKEFLNVLGNLQNAFQTPDGTSETTRNLASLDLPQLTSVLPYHDYGRDNGLFVNRSMVGFLLCAEPLIGTNGQIVYVLEDLIKSKLPRKAPMSFHLTSSKPIGDQLDRGLSELRWQGRHMDEFNRIIRTYYQHVAQQQFSSPTGLPPTLCDYRLYISYCVKAKKRTAAVMTEVAHTLRMLHSSLDVAKIYMQATDDQGLATLAHGVSSARHGQLYPDEVRVNKLDELHQCCVSQHVSIDMRPDDVLISLADRRDSVTSTRVMNFMLESNPSMFMLWMGDDNLSNLLSPDLTITSPLVTMMVMEAENQVATQGEAMHKYLDREKKTNSPYVTLFPSVIKQVKEWKEIREHLNSNQICIIRYYCNVTTSCPDTDENALVCEQQVINTFKKNGISLFSPTYMQFRNQITMTPFIHMKGLWEDIEAGGAICRAKSIQAVNLLPVVVDNRLCQGGLLTPPYHNQPTLLGVHGDGMGNTNCNMVATSTSGVGKTGPIQSILHSVSDSDGIAWVFDMGNGYKSFYENVSGTYPDDKSLKFNPFANISSINESGKHIRDQLAVPAGPNDTLDEIHHSLLLRGVRGAWEARREKARIDHMVQKLTTIRKDDKYQNSPGIINRSDEAVELFGKYCSWEIYGEYFNSDEPSLTDDVRFIALEPGGLQDKPDLLVVVMFSLITHIEDEAYHTPRSLKRCCTIDEGWKLLSFKNEKVGQFIETGYRTVRRRHGAFTTISQNIENFDADDASEATKATQGSSTFKMTLKQDASEFRQYNQNRPNQFSELEHNVIGKFGNAENRWLSSFMLRVNSTCSFHRLLVGLLSRAVFSSKGDDFEFIRQCRGQNMDIHDAVYQLAQRSSPDKIHELKALTETTWLLTKNLLLFSLNSLSLLMTLGRG